MPAGTRLQLPDSYRGQVLVKQQLPDEGSQWASQATFTSFTAWKHGVQPLKTDSAQRRMDYLRICQQVGRRLLDRPIVFNSKRVCSKQAMLPSELKFWFTRITGNSQQDPSGRLLAYVF